ncbi:LamG domain-containing protein [Streptomyces sp. NPDC000878]
MVGLSVLLTGLGAGGLTREGTADAAAPPPVSPTSSAPIPAERTALTRARESGKRVEVVAKRTETMEVYADPKGHFTAVLHPGPVRARQDGKWVAIDTTLVRRPDGSVAPRAAAVSLAFSKGGQEPLVRLGQGGKQVALGWPDPLPAPVLKGDTATYPEVMPGVDLKLTAGSAGFSEVLVVKTRAAAKNPELRKVRFGVQTSGLTLKAGKGGGSELVDAKGKTVFSSPAPAMWDAASNEAVGRFEMAKNAITVIPDRKLLTAPDTKFPVSIDPDWWVPFGGWAKVFSGKLDSSFWHGGGDVEPPGRFGGQNLGKVGKCWLASGTCNGIGAARTFVQFDIRGLHGAQVVTPNGLSGAEFNAHEVYAPACGGGSRRFGVSLVHANPFGSDLTWRNSQKEFPAPIGGTRREMHGYEPGGACGPANIGWGVGDQVRYSNGQGATHVAFALIAEDETEDYSWKKFDAYSLLVHYNWPPDVPKNFSWSAGSFSRPCSTDVNNPDYASNASGPIILRATGTDRDDDNLWMRFERWTRHGSMHEPPNAPGPLVNGSEFTDVIPQGTFQHGFQLSWRARAGDNWGPSLFGPQTGTGMCQLDIDNEKPGRPSATPPSESTVGAPAEFTVKANDPDVVEFRYGLAQGGSQCRTTRSVPAEDLGGEASFKVTPMKAADWDIWVTAVDRAGNVSSDCERHTLKVAKGASPVAQWALDGRWTDAGVTDPMGGHNGTVALGPTRWTKGRAGDALHFTGASDSYVAPGGGPAVATNGSFSVSAWVKLDQANGVTRTAVSQVGDRMSAFSLGYIGEVNRFGFRMASKATDDAELITVTSLKVAQVGVWTHLAGVYDVPTQTMTLYVNGLRQYNVTAVVTTPWESSSVQIGRGKWRGTFGDNWAGDIDEVQIYDRALSDLTFLDPGEDTPRSEVDRLAGTPVEEAYYPLDEGSGGSAGDASGNYRTVGLSNASWVTGKVGGGAVRFADGTGAGLTAQPVVARTDTSFTVAARVRPDVLDDTARTVVSQDGGQHSGFFLQRRKVGSDHKWSFHLVTAPDQTNPTPLSVDAAGSGTVPVQGEWVAIAAVHDAQTGEIRIYVNGHLAGTKAVGTQNSNVTGPLVIGRGRWNGQPAGNWMGSIDEVHVYNGVLADREIAELSAQTEPQPPSAFAGAFGQFAGHDGRRYTGPGPVPPGYYFEGTRGFSAPEGAPDTRPVYSCRYGGGFFLDHAANCAGYEVLGTAGRVYINPPEGVPTLPVYRCVVIASGDHYLSHSDACESTPDKVRTEFLFGYVRTLTPLIRYRGPDGERWTSAHAQFLPSGYKTEKVLGYVSLRSIEGGPPQLKLCEDSRSDVFDEFVSTDVACEGQNDMGAWPSGHLWSEPPDGMESQQLYACRSEGAEWFESLDPFCEGSADFGRPLGYVITRP